jgi:hypothetical protein
MTNLNKIEITDYQIIKKKSSDYDYDFTFPKITFQFKDKSNNLITPTTSNLNMFIYDTTSYINKNILFPYQEQYFFGNDFIKKNSSSELSNYNDYCINNDKSITIFADIGDDSNDELGFDLEQPKCSGIITHIQFSLGHIFAPTIKLDYKNSQISII